MAIFRDNTINPVEHDRSIEDRRRHRQLVEKSIKENTEAMNFCEGY